MFLLQAATIIAKLYEMFVSKDCTLLEINPMAEDTEGIGDVDN